MRDKVLAAIEIYAAGGTITKAIADAGLKSNTPFYATLRKDPEILQLYEAAMKVRSYVMLDEAYEIGSDDELDAKKARAKSEIRFKIAAMSNPDRFGDRMNVQHEVKPSIAAAIAAGKERALLPQRDPAPVIDTTYTEVSNTYDNVASDKQSDAAPEQPGAIEIDPFEP